VILFVKHTNTRFLHGDQMYRGTRHFYYTILKPIVTGFMSLTFAKDLTLKENVT